MLFGGLGALPLSVHIKCRVLCYWNKILNSKSSKICHILYDTSYKLYCVMDVKLPWLKFVHNLLDSLGLSNYWLNNTATPPELFKSIVKTRLKRSVYAKLDQ